MTAPVRALAALICLSLAGVLAAQRPDSTAKPAANTYRYRLLGVFDDQSGDPIEGVEVADVLNGNKSLTSKTGTVSLFFLPDGGGIVRLRKVGYEVQTLTVPISPADTTPVTVVLSHAQRLAPVVVNDSAPSRYLSPLLRGFEERRRLGEGHFITDSVFRRDESHTMADVITAHMPGLMSMPGPGNSKNLVSSRRMCNGPAMRQCRESDCYVTVFVDGAKTYDARMGRSMAPDFAHMSPVEYAAAEFYQGAEIPPQYNATNSECGVLLLWTRER